MKRVIILLILATALIQSQTPYDKFNDKNESVFINEIISETEYKIENDDKDSEIQYGIFKDGFFYFYNYNDDLRLVAQIGKNESKWYSQDPLSRNHPDVSPYLAMGADPIANIDPDGRDYFRSTEGDVKWFDNDSEGFSETESFETWENIGQEYLLFDGKALTYNYQTGEKEGDYIDNSISFNAVSGKPEPDGRNIDYPVIQHISKFMYDIQQQMKGNVGPIPEGFYTVQKNNVQYLNKQPLYKLMLNSFGGGSFPGGYSSWGSNRWWLTPEEKTITYGRDGFSIHGGEIWGSRGCIDLCKNLNEFTSKFLNTNPNHSSTFIKIQYDVENLRINRSGKIWQMFP